MITKTEHEVAAAHRALKRAYKGQCHGRLSRVQGHGQHQTIAYYTNETGERYSVSLTGCTCEGGRKGLICKHSIALADFTGQLDLFIPNVYGDEQEVA